MYLDCTYVYICTIQQSSNFRNKATRWVEKRTHLIVMYKALSLKVNKKYQKFSWMPSAAHMCFLH